MKINTLSKITVAAGIAAAAFSVSGTAHAATTNATLNVANFTSVTSTASVDMTPTITDIQGGSIEQSGAITLNVVTNNGTGCKITVAAGSGDATSSNIAAGDIFLRSAASGTAANFSDYYALTTDAQDLWNTSAASINGTDVNVDVRFGNLPNYQAVGGATKQYANTLTFTAVANS